MKLTSTTLLIIFFITAIFPKILLAQTSITCWAFNLDGNDPTWPGYYNKQISDIGRLSDGFVICGTSYQHIFPSKNGNSIGRTNFGGAYIAKYDFSGNLQWLNYTIDSTYSQSSNWPTFTRITVDENDNIYVCGFTVSKSRYYYNNGNSSIKISTNDTTNANFRGYFIAKLDKQGSPIWHTHVNNRPNYIAYTTNGRLAVNCDVSALNSYYNKGFDSVLTHSQSFQNFSIVQCIYWIDTLDGTLINWSSIKSGSIHSVYITDLIADNNGNTILTGQYVEGINLLSPASNDSLEIPNSTNSDLKLFIAKYDSTGKPIWLVNSKKRMEPISVSVSKDGSVYASLFPFLAFMDTVDIYGSGNSYARVTNQLYHLLAINKDGQIKWITKGGLTSGLGINANDSTIAVAGYTTLQSPPIVNDTFYAANGINNFYLPNTSPNIALAYYDTSGSVLHATRIGTSNGPILYETSIKMIQADQKALIMTGDAKRYNNTDSLLIYNDTLRFNGYDGFVIKTTPGVCDSVNMPPVPPRIFINNSKLDSVLCPGKPFMLYDSTFGTFYNNNTFQVLLTDSLGRFLGGAPIYLASVNSSNVDSILCIVPANVLPGNDYGIKIIPTKPSVATAVSHKIRILSPVVPNVIINSNAGTAVNQGQRITFTAITANGGTNPYYQWYKNGIEISGANSSTYITDTLIDGDNISVKLFSNATCPLPSAVMSNHLLMHVTNGISEVNTFDCKIYPNPNNGTFSIRAECFTEKLTVEVCNALGTIIYKEELPVSNNRIDKSITLPSATAGIYLIKFWTNDYSKTVQFMIK